MSHDGNLHLAAARELAKSYPRETAGFGLTHINGIWKLYSKSKYGQWIDPDSAYEVEEVFDRVIKTGMVGNTEIRFKGPV